MMREAASALAVSAPTWPSAGPGWQARLNAWITRYPQLVFSVGGRPLALSWTAPRELHATLSLHLCCAGHEVWLSLSGLDAIDARLVGAPFMSMPRALRRQVIERLFTECASTLPAPLDAGLQLVDIRWSEEPASGQMSSLLPADECPSLSFEWRNVASSAVSSGRICFTDAAVLDWVLDRFASLPARMVQREELDAGLRISLGSSSIAAHDLSALEEGCFVWIESGAVDAHGMRARIDIDTDTGTAMAHAHIKQRRVSVAQRFTLAAQAMTADASHMENDMNIDVSRLTLKVDFELGELALPVAEVERIGPGYVFELPQEIADAEVLVRVGGRLIAAGEIVAVGRRLGVRITRVPGGAALRGGASASQAAEQTTAGN